MSRKSERNFKPNLLCIVPPFPTNCPPAGAAYLLGYLKANGCFDFDFLDLRLGVPDAYNPTFSYTGTFAEAYVMDIPDLPLVLQLLNAFDEGAPLVPQRSQIFDRYCLERGISPKYLHGYLIGLNRYLTAVLEQIPRIDFIGFSVWTTNYLSTLLAAAHLKRRKIPPLVVAGGPQVTASHASAALGLRSRLFDVVALSEGEETFLDLYNEYSRTHKISQKLPGTMCMDSSTGKLCKTERSPMRMSTLPPPSFAEMHIEAYQDDPGYRTLPFQLSRGCTDKCEFCSEWEFWRRFRLDTPTHAADQIKELQRTYGVNFLVFSDSLLNGVPKRLIAFAEQLLREDISLEWAAFMRAQMDPKTAALLVRAGCHDVFVGIESFSDETLALMNKRRTKADNIQAVEAFLNSGIGVTAGFVPGFPGDTRKAFIRSATVLQHLQEKYPGKLEIHVEPFLVQPNAPIYSKLNEVGLTPKSWPNEYLDLSSRYQDITANILCSVEGASQGVERLGRLNIVKTIKTDEPVRCAYSFQDGEGEVLGVHHLEFEHIYGGWYLAEIKSNVGHVYALLVNQEEREEIEDLQAINSRLDLTNRRVVSTLVRLEKSHLIPPRRRRPRMVRGLYRKEGSSGYTYTVSPFVVARAIGWRYWNQLLIVNFASGRSYRRPANDGPLIEFVAKEPRSVERILRNGIVGRRPQDPDQMCRTINTLKEDGIFVICEV